jgi:predicted lipoprotein with Yx(FWY)xxD motif
VRTGIVALGLAVLGLTTVAGTAPVGASGKATTLLTVHHTSIGNVIAASNGVTLYLFEADKGKKSVCNSSCASVWPPLIVHGQLKATGGAKKSLLGTIRRSNGTKQVTYAGHPLYYFVSDTQPGSVTGEGIQSFGAGWDALTPGGKKIEKSGS